MVKIVSVVRDFEMYSRCITRNANCEGCDIVCFDNRQDNVSIPERYNSFIDANRDECWIVFCHEDWQPLREVKTRVEQLDPGIIHGIIGSFFQKSSDKTLRKGIKGWVKMVDKKRNRHCDIKGFEISGQVSTLDCQCVIVHSSLLEQYRLRFDPSFPFDLYVEDFCATAYELHKIETWTIDLPSIHHSYGTLNERFYETLKRLREKFSKSGSIYVSIVDRRSFFGAYQPYRLRHLHIPLSLRISNAVKARKYWQ